MTDLLTSRVASRVSGRPHPKPVFTALAALLRAAPLAALAALPCAAPLAAQDSGTAPRVLRLPASTRAMALGDAYMMNSGHADAVFYHPALVDGAAGFGLDVQVWSGEATSASASAATGWYGGTVAVGLQSLQYGAPSDALDAHPAGQDLLFAGGSAPVSERVATLGYARELFGVRLGVAGKLIEERVSDDRAAVGAVDVGLATEVGPITVGLSAQNLGPDPELGAREVALPRRFTLGAGAYGRPVGPLDLGLTGAVTYEQEEFVPAAGLEVGYWPVVGRTFLARAGVRRVVDGDASPFSVGAAFWGDDIVLEWAFRPFGGDVDEGTHRFGVRWR